jgi:2-methylisocitrate lyase-like PEP mutase family enzyme
VTEQRTQTETFRSLHRPGEPLVLVNAWDAASAAIIAAAGAPAVATTSAGVAWSLGAPDGDALGRQATVDAVRRVAAVVRIPVSADIESGYGDTPEEVAATAAAVRAAGAVGVNIEDGTRDVAAASERIAACRGQDLFVNARIDTFLRGTGDLADTVARAAAFVEAGADGVFVPGVTDPATIAVLVREIPAPLNVLAGPGSPPVKDLAGLGVARISLGSAVAEAAYAVARRAADEAYHGAGGYRALDGGLDYGTLNALVRG